MQLFYEHNYEMARMCFEKAGDTYNEKFVRAANLQALANSISSSSPQIAKNYLNEAADLFEGIGKAEYAAKCFFELKNYERADSSNSAILQPKMIATANAWEMKDDTSLLKQGGHLRGFEC
ncbi:hypothetical protein CK203_104295 [Vitis vinifera]|uniref:Uncharacterized protein n=1 Tax=Vitis vinifera TaxID=29760 RepID=A0A438EJI0_VITVI|nr:hypothetical protein CK203_104295 [Vitis vinifera]